MKKSYKITLCVIGFLILLTLSATLAYYLATEKKLPSFFDSKEPSSSASEQETQPTEPPKDKSFPMMKTPVYDEYAISYIKMGNHLGNLQNGGRVAPTLSMVYQSIPAVGLFKFSQDTEGVAYLPNPSETGQGDDYGALNILDGKLVYIDNKNSVLYSVTTNGTNRVKLAEGVLECFLYDKNVYFVTAKGVYSISVEGGTVTTLFEKEGLVYSLVGLSNSRIYFSAIESTTCHWYTVSLYNSKKDQNRFMEDSSVGALVQAQYTNGWLYYLKKTATNSDLYRRHIGEEETRIAENVLQYVVDKNCIYFGRTEGTAFDVIELNSDNGVVKTVLTTPITDNNNDMSCYIGGEYVYAVGTDLTSGKSINCRGSLMTAANDVMYYNANSRSWGFKN